MQRFVSIWFPQLTTDWCILQQPALRQQPFVLATKEHGRMVITAMSGMAAAQGLRAGMTVADARALVPALQVLDAQPALPARLLNTIGEWCIRYTPVSAIDLPDGLLLDVSGCAHLWGGEQAYLDEITKQLQSRGYEVRAAMADTIGVAWAMAHFGASGSVVAAGDQATLLLLPPAALRLEPVIIAQLHKLGLYRINSFIHMQRSVLRRRFGARLLLRLDQALGIEEELLQPLQPPLPYQERLPCLEPIMTATGIEIALQRLLAALCARLQQEGKGLRTAVFKGYRTDGKTVQLEIFTNRASHHTAHLFALFGLKIATLEPAPGIELFTMNAGTVEMVSSSQESIWGGAGGLEDARVAELLDRLAGKIGSACIHRYLPDEHHWPERSVKPATALDEPPAIPWQSRPRPVHLLAHPEAIEVSAPVPDYPPMLFRYKGQLHQIKKADGPERIEQEWWLEGGQHRDYYVVEDAEGQRYWLFRSGHYTDDKTHSWFIHGFFA